MDPRVQTIKDYFADVEIDRDGRRGNIVKINMYPNAKKFFLTVDDLVNLAGLNSKYKDYYLDVNQFCTALCQGKYSMGSGITQKLKTLHDRVKELEDELNFKMEMEENLIEEDMNNLKDLMMNQLEEYFTSLKAKLKSNFHSNNKALKESLVDANSILKHELLSALNEEEFFDLNKFFVQFNELKDTPEDFEDFLKDYINNDKAIQLNKNAVDRLNQMSPIFDEEYDIDSKMCCYILNIEKLSHSFVPHEDDMATVLEGFSQASIKQIDQTMMKAKHFTIGEEVVHPDQVQVAGEGDFATPGKPGKNKTKVSLKKSSKGKSKKPRNEIECIKFKNVHDLQYDYKKFANSNVTKAILELHGEKFNEKTCDYMGQFLSSLYRLESLKMNFSM